MLVTNLQDGIWIKQEPHTGTGGMDKAKEYPAEYISIMLKQENSGQSENLSQPNSII
jgi:hypothetical protein